MRGRSIIAAALASVIAGCGGAGGDYTPTPPPTVLLDTDAVVSGGSDTSQTTSWTRLVDGPQFVLSSEKVVTICAKVTWVQRVRQPVGLALTYTPTGPVQGTSTASVEVLAQTSADTSVTLERCNDHTIGPGTFRLQGRARIDTSCACMTALSGYTVTVAWRVTSR